MVAAYPQTEAASASFLSKLNQLKKIRRLQAGLPGFGCELEPNKPEHCIPTYKPEQTFSPKTLMQDVAQHHAGSVHWSPSLEELCTTLHVPGAVQEPAKPILKRPDSPAANEHLGHTQFWSGAQQQQQAEQPDNGSHPMHILAYRSEHAPAQREKMAPISLKIGSRFATPTVLPAKRARDTASFAS